MANGMMEKLLRLMAEKSASDLYLSANAPILLKVNGQLVPVTDHVLAPSAPRQLLPDGGAGPDPPTLRL